MNWKGVSALIALGVVAGLVFASIGYDRQVAELKTHADSVAISAARKDSIATALVDSINKAVTARDSAERAAKAVAADAAKRVKIFHDALHDAVTDNAKALALLDSLDAAHATEVAALKQANTEADTKVLLLTASNTALLQTVHDLNGQVADLNARIQALHKPPTLAIKILKGASYVGAVIIGYEVGKKK